MSPGSLNTTCLDAMVLRLFKDWEHTDWFWKNPEGSNGDALLKRVMVRSSSLLRRKHEEVPLVQWAEPKDPYILFIGSVVLGAPMREIRGQADGLMAVLAAHWDTHAINAACSWIQDREHGSWSRCAGAARAQKIIVSQIHFSLLAGLSEQLQTKLHWCMELGLKPTYALLSEEGRAIALPNLNAGLSI